ncbi:MAG: hypothetical protein C0599_11365 [Salinivirgaceae bacterium]|nr:MAG: hypothetical protein C0599_11365 [Salinivirgaceae bacterium]
MAQLKEIKAGIGLDNIKFGMFRDDVKNILGEPDEIDNHTDNEDEGQTESWHYDELELSISFEEVDDMRLFSIAVSGEHYEFNGKKLIGSKKPQLLKDLKDLNITDLKEEAWETDDETKQELIFSEDLSLNFWMEDYELSEIQFGPLFEGEETIKWPE